MRQPPSMTPVPHETARTARLRVVDSFTQVEAQNQHAVLAIGNFDGVHRGHQALIAQVLDIAHARHKPAGVLMFEPHPRQVFKPDAPHFRLTDRSLQLELLAQLGLDLAVILPFNSALSSQSAMEFVDKVLVGGLNVSHVAVGEDFRFGKGRQGDARMLDELCARHQVGVSIVAKVGEDGLAFGSSAIRHMISRGDVASAARALGRYWRVRGEVVGGDKRGRVLGFPTANVALPKGTELAHGIYAARVYVGGDVHEGAAYFGSRPQFDGEGARLEVFLLDFKGDLYGQTIDVEFIEHLRGDERFPDVAAMTAQIARDVAATREILARIGEASPHQGLPLSSA